SRRVHPGPATPMRRARPRGRSTGPPCGRYIDGREYICWSAGCHGAGPSKRGKQDSMAAQPLEVILMRELAAHLSTPIFVVDPDGNLLFYNEPAEQLLGSRFEETGMMPFKEWATAFAPTNGRGTPLAPEELPLSIAVLEQRPAQGRIWISALDGK